MKVLFTTNYPAPYKVHFFNELGKLCDLTVIFEETPEEQTHRNKDWFVTDYSNFTTIFLKHYKFGKDKPDRPHKIIAPSIIKIMKEDYDYRIVNVYSTYSSIIAILYMQARKIPYWISTDGGMAKDGKGAQEKLKKRLLSGAEGYFSPSKLSDEYLISYGAQNELIHRYPFTSLTEKDILDYPVSAESKKILRTELGMTEEKIVLSVGQFIPRKGFDILIRAASETSENVGYYLIGGKPTSEYLDLRKKLGLEKRVHFIDFKEKKELEKYYKVADLFVFPTREDIWGLVINEAMAYGLPVITTDKCGAGAELIDVGSNGFIVSSDNYVYLGELINSTLLRIENNIAMQSNCLKVARHYTLESMARKYWTVLSSLL